MSYTTNSAFDYALSSDEEEALGDYYFGPHQEDEDEDYNGQTADKEGDDGATEGSDLLKHFGLATAGTRKERREAMRERTRMQHRMTLHYLEKLKTWDTLSDTMLEKVVELVYTQRTKICNGALEVLCRYAATQQPPQQQSTDSGVHLAFHAAFEKTALLREEAPLGRLVDLSTHRSEKVRYKSLWLVNFLLRKSPNEAYYISLMDHLNTLYLPHALVVSIILSLSLSISLSLSLYMCTDKHLGCATVAAELTVFSAVKCFSKGFKSSLIAPTLLLTLYVL